MRKGRRSRCQVLPGGSAPKPGGSRPQRTWQASRIHVGDRPAHGGAPGVSGQCDPCRELTMQMPWALSLSTLRPRLLKGHKNTFLLSQFHASLFYFGCTRRAETPKPLPRHEVSEPRGGAWDPSSIYPPPPARLPYTHPPFSPLPAHHPCHSLPLRMCFQNWGAHY